MTANCIRVVPATAAVVMALIVYATLQVASVEGRNEPHKFTVDELLSAHFEYKESGDIGMDPCKAGE